MWLAWRHVLEFNDCVEGGGGFHRSGLYPSRSRLNLAFALSLSLK